MAQANKTANTVRATVKHDLVIATLTARGNWADNTGRARGAIEDGAADKGRNAEQLESLLRQLAQMSEGTFGPFSQQPLVRAELLLMGGFGWTVLIENGIVPGL